MAATIDIIGSGGVKHSAVFEEASVRKFELMKEDYVRLVFSTKEQLAISLGDYIQIGSGFNEALQGRFEITKPQQPTFNATTGGYDYDLQFDAPHYKWNNKLFKFEPSTKRNEASWSLTDTLQNHMAVFLRNLAYYGWNYTVDPASYQMDSASRVIFIQYSNKYLLDALTQIAEAFECEWWITDNIIHFGKCESGTAIDFTIGQNVESMGSEKGEQEYITRLYGFGSTRNLPPDYRQNDEQVLLNGVVQKRVMLPVATPFVDIAEGLSTEEIVEGIVTFDDVYPRLDCHVTDLHTDIREVEDEDSEEEGATISVPIYRFKDSSLTFSKDYILPGVQLQVQFQSGALNGMIFDLAFNPDDVAEDSADGQWFEIVRNDTYGLYLPNDTLLPAVNDSFVLLGWNVKKLETGLALITAAEREVLTRTREYAAKLQIDPNVYPCKMMADYMYGVRNGHQDPTATKVGTFPLGQRVRLNNDNFFAGGSRLSRVIGYEYKLDLPYDGAVIYVGESATYSSKKAAQDAITEVSETINYKGGSYTGSGGGGGATIYIITTNDDSTPTDGNVYSALRTERQFTRKDQDDSVSALWTFNHGNGVKRGIQTRDYRTYGDSNEDNLFGKGFELVEKPDGNGGTKTRMEVDELFVRIKAFFAQLEIREMSYVGGNYAFSSAGSKIYYVEWLDALGNILPRVAGNVASIYKFRCYLYSDDGTTATMNKWAADDQALCETFNIDSGVHQNTSNKRYWRRVIGIGKGVIQGSGDTTQYQYVDISMSDCEASSAYPEAEDTIVQIGNWSNASRQGVIYLKVEGSGSPAIMEYSGVGANGQHFVLPSPTLLLSPTKNVIYGEFHSVVDEQGGNTGQGDTIEDQLAALIERLNDIQNQADKKFDIWFGTGVPLPSVDNPTATANYPASEWPTEALKALHSQDIYYNTNREPAAQGGRAWRWIAIESNGVVAYRWDEILDADTLASLEKIADVASDGIITGGAEKTRVYIDWMKAVQEYYEYKERAEDYEITTEWDTYRAAFLALGKMLNNNTDLVQNLDGTYQTPAWFADLQSETTIPSPVTYRQKWNDYYAALAVLLQTITKKAKELADAAQQTADEAIQTLTEFASDGYLTPDEKLTVKREFIAAFHEMCDDTSHNRPAGILDQASDGNGGYIISSSIVNLYINAYKNVGKYLNGGTNWNIPSTEEIADADLPAWIKSANMTRTENISTDSARASWLSTWETFYSARTAVLTALTELAQSTADGAHDRIDDIVSDGVISAGSEKSLLYIDWLKTVDEYSKYISQATDYFGANYAKATALTTAYKKLAAMLNGQDPSANPLNVDAGILNGSTRPLWLNSTNINNDTVLSTATINGAAGTPDAYRTIWNNYHIALTDLLEAITKKAKELADAAQADATEALERLDDITTDGKLTLDELPLLRREFEAAYRERADMTDLATNDTTHKLIDSVLRSFLDNYLASFKSLVAYLQMGGNAWTEPATYSVTNGQGVADGEATYNVGVRVPLRNLDFPAMLNIVDVVTFQADWSNPTTAGDGGAQFRHLWADLKDKQVSLANAMATLAKNNADTAQETADDAQGKIADIVSDGIISGGAEKSQLYIDWLKALHEYGEYTEQAEDYNVSSTAYENAFKTLAAMLNNQNPYADPLTVADAILNGTTRPNWLTATNLLVDTDLSETQTLNANNYRSIWNGYYVALTNLLEAINTKAKELADEAQETADDAVSRIEAIAADGYLTDTEIPDVRKEFLVALHEIFDSGGLLDQSTVRGVFINADIQNLCQSIETAIKAIGTFLNGGTNWTYTKTQTTITDSAGSYTVYGLNFNTLTLPLYLQSTYNYTAPIAINGATFTSLWSDYYTLRTNILGALADAAHDAADQAQGTADDAHDRIDDIVDDGIISGGSEKCQLYKEWMRTKEEYFDYYARANGYGFNGFNTKPNNSTEYGYYQDYLAFNNAFDALVLMMNGGTYGGVQSEVNKDHTNRTVLLYNGDQLAWLYNLQADTVIGNYSYTDNGSSVAYTAAKYRQLWNTYYYASVKLLNDFAEYSKALADEALHQLEEITDDGKITPAEKNTILLNWREVITEYPVIKAQADTYTNALASGDLKTSLQSAASAYILAFNTLATLLNGGTTYSYTFSPANFPTPSWLGTYFERTEELTSQQKENFNAAWDGYYNTRTALQDIFVDVAKKSGDDALGELDNLAADDVLTPFEKLTVLREWDAAYAEYAKLTAQANKTHVGYTAYTNAFYRLGNYLYDKTDTTTDRHVTYSTMSGSILVADGDTAISGSLFKTLWSNYYKERSDLVAALATSHVSYFVGSSVPSAPYFVGDLWLKLSSGSSNVGSNVEANGEMMVCVNDCTTAGQETEQDWANMKEITEKRDPRIILAALANMVYSYCGGYVQGKSSNQYMNIYLGSKPSSANAEGDMSYDGTNLWQWGSGSTWVSITNESVRMAFKAMYQITGEYTIRVFKYRPSFTARLYDLVCSRITFTDNQAPSGYQTVEGGIQIQMYNGSDWEVLQESTRSILENLPGYVRAVAIASANGVVNSSGFITSSDWATLFSQATDADGNIIAEAHLGTFITKVSDGNGGYKIESGVKIDADKVIFTGKTIDLSADQIAFTGKTIINNKFVVHSDGHLQLDYMEAKDVKINGIISSPFVVENSQYSYVWDGDNNGNLYYAAMSHDNLLYNSGSHYLYWLPECSGRLITLCHHESVTGSTTFDAPTVYSTNAPSTGSGEYLWARGVVKYANGLKRYTDPFRISNGSTVSSVTKQYYLSDSASSLTGGSWSSTAAVTDGKHIWVRCICYTYDGTVTSDAVLLSNALNDTRESVDIEFAKNNKTSAGPADMCFYEDGQKKKSITVSRQCVILKGYGTDTVFLGYIVVKRIDLAPIRSYGMTAKCLAMGVIGSNSTQNGVVFGTANYVTFDGSKLTGSRVETGVYRINIPDQWRVLASKLQVMVASSGVIFGGTNPLYAGLQSIEEDANGIATSFTVQCGDDSSRNDGSVQFMLFNRADWETI